MTVRQGTIDVTDQVYAGTYRTGLLLPGRKVDLQVTIKRTSTTRCIGQAFEFEASGPDGPVSEFAHVANAA